MFNEPFSLQFKTISSVKEVLDELIIIGKNFYKHVQSSFNIVAIICSYMCQRE